MVGAGLEEEGEQTAGWDKAASEDFTRFLSPFFAARTPLPVTGCPCLIADPARVIAPAKPPPRSGV